VIAVNERGCDVQMVTGEDAFIVNGVEEELFGYNWLKFEASGRDGYRTFTIRLAQVTPDGVLQTITNTPAGEQLVYNAREQAPKGYKFEGQPTLINFNSDHFYGILVKISNGKETRYFAQCARTPSF
jgi:hypothetical protein